LPPRAEWPSQSDFAWSVGGAWQKLSPLGWSGDLKTPELREIPVGISSAAIRNHPQAIWGIPWMVSNQPLWLIDGLSQFDRNVVLQKFDVSMDEKTGVALFNAQGIAYVKNKFVIAFGYFVLLAISGVSDAQTIGEMAEAAKSKQIPVVGQVSPPLTQGASTTSSKLPKIDSGAMLVTSIYTSKEVYQAGISVGEAEIYVGPGDPVISGWIVDSISSSSVILKKCNSQKRCESKTLAYTLTH